MPGEGLWCVLTLRGGAGWASIAGGVSGWCRWTLGGTGCRRRRKLPTPVPGIGGAAEPSPSGKHGKLLLQSVV